MKKLSGWKTKGMNRDLSVSAFNPEFAFENMNLRLSTNEGNTTLSWVNEKGTKSLTMMQSKEGRGAYMGPASFTGVCVGTAVLNQYLVLFITDGDEGKDYIYRLNHVQNGYMQVKLLYKGDLNFRPDHPLETMVSYEAEDIQKVYWTDAVNSEDNEKWNQPRVINIVSESIREDLDTQFDFIPTLQLTEIVKVRKVTGGGGMFAPGVIQYAFTYYFKHGQESNIFYTTPLIYISHIDRGASPEDKVDNIFKITINRLDTHFDFLRIYSIQRTSINSTPICKRIQDIAIEGEVLSSKSASFTDTGTTGNSIDPTELLYKGGSPIAVGTMEQKDNTLFMGDVATPRMDDLTVFESGAHTWKLKDVIRPRVTTRTFYPIQTSTGDYEYANQLNSYDTTDGTGSSVPCAGFKYGNRYRCGIQFQDEWGRWTTPVWLEDLDILNSSSDEGDIRPAIDKASGEEPGGEGGEEPGTPETNMQIGITIKNNIPTHDTMYLMRTLYLILNDGTRLLVNLHSANDTAEDFIIDFNGGEEWEMYSHSIAVNGNLYPGRTVSSVEVPPSQGGKYTYTCALEAADEPLEEGHSYSISCTAVTVKEDPVDPTPVDPPTPGGTGIKFVITNNLGVEVRLSGRVILNVSRNPNDWANSTQVNANMHDATVGTSWAYNDIIIQPGSTYTKAVASVDPVYQDYLGTDFLDGTWYFMNSDNSMYVHSIYLYSRIWNTQKNESSGSNHMYVVQTPPQNTALQGGGTYYLTVDWLNPEATLQPTNTGHYVILSYGNTGL